MDEFNANGQIEELNEFELGFIKKSEVIHVIGAPSSGKTFLILFLSYALKHIYPAAVVYCGTEDSQGCFTPVFGGAFVSSTYSEHDHKRNISRQIMCFKEKCDFGEIISIIDDFGYNKKTSKSDSIVKSHKNGAQWFHELQIMGYQSIRDIPEELINSPSKVFIFMEKEDSNRRKLHRAYFKTLIPEYKDFCQLMNDICLKHVCLVVDLKKQSSVLSECVTWFKAPYWVWDDPSNPDDKHPYPKGFRFGCKQYQEWSDQRFDKNYASAFLKELEMF